MEGKTNFLRRLKQYETAQWLDLTDPDTLYFMTDLCHCIHQRLS